MERLFPIRILMWRTYREKDKSGKITWESEYDDDWVKDYCIRCKLKIKNSIQNYETRGNWCGPCISEINELAQLAKIEARLKKERDEN